MNFEDLTSSHPFTPLDSPYIDDITKATEASWTIILELQHEKIKRTGDVFFESTINFLTVVIWYLLRYEDTKYGTLPHVIELMQIDYDKFFIILIEEETKILINPFISACYNKTMAQLASAKVGITRLHHLNCIMSFRVTILV